MISSERLLDEQRLSGALDFAGETSVPFGRHASDTTREDAALFGDELLEQLRVLKVHSVHIDINAAAGEGAVEPPTRAGRGTAR